MLALGYPGLRYRVFHDQRPSDTSISAAVMNAADVDSLIRGLYSVSPERQKDVIERLYDENVLFVDPLVLVRGHRLMLCQFRALSAMFSRISVCITGITQGNPPQSRPTDEPEMDVPGPIGERSPLADVASVFMVDAFVTFEIFVTLLWVVKMRFPFRIRQVSRLEVNSTRKVILHEDLWSIHEALNGLLLLFPLGHFLAYVNDLRTWIVGAISSVIIGVLISSLPL
mmetsp:Transcript_17265/g.35047  ORF Transcript_17265/g.35047 Transcript_17265/m.35047 type:complete len:227 (-) Transcript_17265:291-971(-)